MPRLGIEEHDSTDVRGTVVCETGQAQALRNEFQAVHYGRNTGADPCVAEDLTKDGDAVREHDDPRRRCRLRRPHRSHPVPLQLTRDPRGQQGVAPGPRQNDGHKVSADR